MYQIRKVKAYVNGDVAKAKGISSDTGVLFGTRKQFLSSTFFDALPQDENEHEELSASNISELAQRLFDEGVRDVSELDLSPYCETVEDDEGDMVYGEISKKNVTDLKVQLKMLGKDPLQRAFDFPPDQLRFPFSGRDLVVYKNF